MKPNRRKMPTKKEFMNLFQDTRHKLIATQSQVTALTEIFSDLLDFMGNKVEFVDYLKKKREPAAPGSVENPEVVQEPLEKV